MNKKERGYSLSVNRRWKKSKKKGGVEDRIVHDS